MATTAVSARSADGARPAWRLTTAVSLLYGIILAALVLPVVFVLFWSDMQEGDVTLRDVPWQLWAIVGAFTAAQFGLLAARADTTLRRRSGRAPLVIPISAGLFGGALIAGGYSSVIELIFQARVPESAGWAVLWIAIASWLGWALVFARATRSLERSDAVARVCAVLLRGSVLELLVAVPTHVIARRRGYCCAGVYTGVGIGLGIAVMLASYGPAVFVLFADRWRRLHPQDSLRGPLRRD